MGIRVRGGSLRELIAPAAEGLYAAFGELKPADGDRVPFHFSQSGRDEAVLLRDFLTELHILFERDHRILADIESAQFGGGRLEVRGTSAKVDSQRSSLCREVKAVTYHELAIRLVDGGFEATVIVDI